MDVFTDYMEYISHNNGVITKYNLILEIFPLTNSIQVKGNFIFRATQDSCNFIRFALGHNEKSLTKADFQILALSVNGYNLDYAIDGYKIEIDLPKKLISGDSVIIDIEYKCKPLGHKCWVNDDAKGSIDKELETELCVEGLYLPFANKNFEGITTNIEVVVPSNMIVAFNGFKLSESIIGTKKHCKYKSLVPGMPTIVAGDFQVVSLSQDNNEFVFYYQKGYSKTAQQCLDAAKIIYEKLQDLMKCEVSGVLQLVQLKRTHFGQYAPSPMVLFPYQDIKKQMTDNEIRSFNRMLSHEIAHFWFGGLLQSSLSEQWLSEGFASFIELYFNKLLYGETAYKEHIKADIKTLSMIPIEEQLHLSNIPINNKHQFLLVRVKGTIVLECLRQYIGDENMLILIRGLVLKYKNNLITTDIVEEFCIKLLPEFNMAQFFNLHIRGVGQYSIEEDSCYINFIK